MEGMLIPRVQPQHLVVVIDGLSVAGHLGVAVSPGATITQKETSVICCAQSQDSGNSPLLAVL